jgi:hypothetical protein
LKPQGLQPFFNTHFGAAIVSIGQETDFATLRSSKVLTLRAITKQQPGLTFL